MVNGVDSKRPIGPHSQVQNVAATTIASGDNPIRRPNSQGSIAWPKMISNTANKSTVAIAIVQPGSTLSASSTGTIQGRVTDTSGAILPGVTVTAASPSMIGTQSQVSNENGSYRFPAVPPGTYELTFELAGFNTVKRSGVQISLGFTANVNAEMKVGGLEETVTVTGASPVVDIQNARSQTVLSQETLDTLPSSRAQASLANFIVGMTTDASIQALSPSAARAQASSFSRCM